MIQQAVALKFLPETIAQDPEAKQRFLREAQAAAILDDPNICPVYEIDEAGGEMFLTMALIEGRSLKDRIADGPFPLIEALSVAAQVAEGLGAAHQKGVVHRDVKPANIMLNREGQVRGEKADARTDIWSFGVLLFEMAAGRRPFLGQQGRAVRAEILNEDPPRPAAIRTEIPAGLEAVILKCLAKKPEDRFPDFEALLAALRSEGVRGSKAAGGRRLPEPSLPWPSFPSST